ncbi:MAG: NAD(P)/FAD-dependent oxidoreductase [Thermoanaerobaculia bacterium]
MHVAVIGAGAIGLLTAYHLRKRGAEVTLLDRAKVGEACSSGNAGWITPAIAVPVPSPEVRTTSLRWLLQPGSPLYIKPTAIPAMVPWLWRFWRHCNTEDFERGTRALAALGADTLDQFDRLEADGLSFEQHRDGLLMVFGKQSSMDGERALLERTGYGPFETLSPDAIRKLEPALRGPYVGGILVKPERHLRPELLCRAVAGSLAGNRTAIVENAEAFGFEFRGRRASRLATRQGPVVADAYVIATGAEASRLARQCGTRLPIQAGKGYSLTVEDPATRIHHPLYLAEAKIGVAPFESAVRVAGTMELSGINSRLDPRRIASLRRAAETEVPGICDGSRVREWVGMRPLTPDGLPVIGRLPEQDNVFIAGGHQMMGIFLAPSTGRVIAELIVDGESSVDLEPFAPNRFRKQRRPS